MVSTTFNESEEGFIRYLGGCLKDGRINLTRKLVREELELTETEYESLIRMADNLGLIEDVECTDGYFATWFKPTFEAVQRSRNLDAAEESERQPDVVEQIIRRVKARPVTAWIVIVIVVVVFLYPTVMDLFERFGWISMSE